MIHCRVDPTALWKAATVTATAPAPLVSAGNELESAPWTTTVLDNEASLAVPLKPLEASCFETW